MVDGHVGIVRIRSDSISPLLADVLSGVDVSSPISNVNKFHANHSLHEQHSNPFIILIKAVGNTVLSIHTSYIVFYRFFLKSIIQMQEAATQPAEPSPVASVQVKLTKMFLMQPPDYSILHFNLLVTPIPFIL